MNAAARIGEVESILSGGAHFVKITAENGNVGIGQSACWAYPDAVHAVAAGFRGYLLGKDARDVDQHWNYLYRTGPFRGSILGGALSAIDIALWDLKAQQLQAPIWDVMGGRCRDKIRLLALLLGQGSAADFARRAKAAGEEGYTAIKFSPIPDAAANMTLARIVSEMVDRLAAVREAVGRDVDIVVELNRKLGPLTAGPVLEALRRFDPLFVEDPFPIDSIIAQAEVARDVPFAMAHGERIHTLWEFRELLVAGGSQHVRPDIGLSGGFTHTRKIAALAESFYASVSTHNFLSPLLTTASAHLDTVIPNFVVQEFNPADEAYAPGIFIGGAKRKGGYLLPPEEPGLGIRIDFAKASALGPNLRPLDKMPLRDDGSIPFQG